MTTYSISWLFPNCNNQPRVVSQSFTKLKGSPLYHPVLHVHKTLGPHFNHVFLLQLFLHHYFTVQWSQLSGDLSSQMTITCDSFWICCAIDVRGLMVNFISAMSPWVTTPHTMCDMVTASPVVYMVSGAKQTGPLISCYVGLHDTPGNALVRMWNTHRWLLTFICVYKYIVELFEITTQWYGLFDPGGLS